MKYIPHDYQKKAIKFLVAHHCAGLFLDPGLGKTSITLKAFKLLKTAGMLERMLVIAPLRPAYSTWPAEVELWDDFRDLTINVLHGPDKEEKLNQHADIDVINPEGLRWLFSKVRKTSRQPWPWQMLTVDESTRFKHANTARFKVLKPVLPHFDRRVILTGSPAPNGLLDLFGQIFILDLGHTLGQFISHYKLNYFDQVGYQGYVSVPKPEAPSQIYEKLKPLVLRMDGRDLLDMPPLIGVDPPLRVDVALDAKSMAAYRQMEEQLITMLEEDVVTAANAAAATNKCRQIANGGIYHEGGEKWSHIHEIKTEAVVEIVEELQGKPALVAYEYKHDLDRLRKRLKKALGKEPPFIGGGVSPARFREIEGAWNRGEIPVLLAQPQSVAHGLNLQGTGAAVIWHSLTWDLEVYEQFIRRIWRQGQKEKVICHHIIARKTIDEVILKMLGKKDRTQKDLLSALKTHYRRKAA